MRSVFINSIFSAFIRFLTATLVSLSAFFQIPSLLKDMAKLFTNFGDDSIKLASGSLAGSGVLLIYSYYQYRQGFDDLRHKIFHSRFLPFYSIFLQLSLWVILVFLWYQQSFEPVMTFIGIGFFSLWMMYMILLDVLVVKDQKKGLHKDPVAHVSRGDK